MDLELDFFIALVYSFAALGTDDDDRGSNSYRTDTTVILAIKTISP